MIRYIFADDDVIAIKNAKEANPQTIGEELAKLSDKAGGDLTPKAVVEAARNKKSPLHKHFEWDDKVAADKFRQDQAREIIRCIRVEDDESEEPRRAFLSVTDRGGVSYRTLGDVKKSPDLQKAVLKAAYRDLDAFEKRYKELTDVCSLVRKAKSKTGQRLEQFEERPGA